VLHQGPVPFFLHGLLDYIVGALLIAAPFVLGFDDIGSATALSIVSGVVLLAVAAASDGPVSLVNSIPRSVHILIDVGMGAFFIAAPFLFGFSDEGTPTAFFLVLGVLGVLSVIATRFPEGPSPRRGREARPEPPAP
jgi:VIT1/CCC1 family predicted Fe2+/Mn2+ transporter